MQCQVEKAKFILTVGRQEYGLFVPDFDQILRYCYQSQVRKNFRLPVFDRAFFNVKFCFRSAPLFPACDNNKVGTVIARDDEDDGIVRVLIIF